ncbi:agamous-like MADS-box AGL81 [Olea europaea subsp. europaea]|uniref:Agamous-like MADS-box AGL81 n=1 Tax=Olea europaea subsp. europaea TaxID=158383 RepID=A0A8S0PKM1_OLEEU|nr:agamous-like MADS-box AGL81 [Olea europaea subsp. europaea]
MADADVLRAKKKAFLRRKECIKRKTMELSTLCDVKACAVILGPDGQIDSWPENRSEVQEVINLYQHRSRNKKRKQQYDDRGCNKKQVLGGDEGALNPEEFLKKIDAKLGEVKKRIQFLRSKDQEIKPGWPKKDSQNLGSHSNVGMLEFGNQLPTDIGGFPSNVHAMDFGPETSFQPSQAAFSQLQQQLHMEQPWNCIDSPFWFEPESALSTGGKEILQSYIDNNDESCWMQSPLFQDTYCFSQTVETPFCCDLQGWTAANCDQPPRLIQGIDNNDESCWMQSPLFQDTYCFSPTVETPFCCELQGCPQKDSQNLGSHSNVGMLEFGNQLPVDIGGFPGNVHAMDFGPETSFQSSQAAFSQLQQQLHMEQPWNCIDSSFWFEPESALLTGDEQFLQSYIDNNDESSWMQSPLFQETYCFSPTVETFLL